MRLALIFSLAILSLLFAWWMVEERIPRHWHPGESVRVDDPLTLITRWKLRNLDDDPEGCLNALRTAPDRALRFTPLPDHEPVEGCPLENTVRVHGSSVDFNSSFIASCPLALAWVIFERRHLQPAAESSFGTRVSGVDHYGSFACRRPHGRESGRLSEHATAEALDVAAFRLDDGRRVILQQHWGEEGEPGEFLLRIRDGACDLFGNVLGPEYNTAHADHFHLGMRRFGLCR